MEIYLIAGKAGSGKGEVSRIIKEYYLDQDRKPIITGFSKYLKLYAHEILDLKESDAKPRKFLQELGVTIKENMDMPNLLIKRMLEDLKIYALYSDIIIISDVRYPEEIEEIKKVYPNTKTIYVINQFAKSELSIEEQMHVTETALENYGEFDITITNDNLNVLDNKVIEFIERVEN